MEFGIGEIGTVFAIFLGIFNLYWVIFHNRKKLVVSVIWESVRMGMIPDFVILNGGKNDWLITKLECFFTVENPLEAGTGISRTVYPHIIDWKGEDTLLLKPGMAKHFNVKLVDKFQIGFIKSGELMPRTDHKVYSHYVNVMISWIDMNGKTNEKSICTANIGLSEEGKVLSWNPMEKTVNLLK